MKDEKSILYVQTSDQPERQYSPLVLAQTAKAMDLNPKVYYLGMGLKVLKPGAADEIKLGTFPSVAEMISIRLRGIQADAGLGEGGPDSGSEDSRCGHVERFGAGSRRHHVVLI
jgi:hypothetical protein